MDKRTFVKSVLLGVAGVFATGMAAKALRTRKQWDGVFRLPELPYSLNSLEPFVDAETLRNHLQHHVSFTNGLNEAVAAHGLNGKTAREILQMASEYPPYLRDCAGGYVNHRLFWRILTPQPGTKPTGQFTAAIERDFGSTAEFRKEFKKAALSVFGSGWAWLVIERSGSLKVTATSNNDNPMMDLADIKGFPLICLDVWDHAVNGKKDDYIDFFWKALNWDIVSKRYCSSLRYNLV